MTENLTEIYWLVFFIFRNFFWTMTMIVIVLGILRPIVLYAFANPITIDNDFVMSCLWFRIAWRAIVTIGWEEDNDEAIRGPYGADIRGTGIDILVTFVGGTILAAIWPVVAIVLIGIFPLQAMHTHYKRKKDFVAKLKGEHETA